MTWALRGPWRAGTESTLRWSRACWGWSASYWPLREPSLSPAAAPTRAGRWFFGRAIGLDLWRGIDQTGNSGVATRANACAEGVADRVDLRTGDMASMPFGDAEFDLVVASMALHNVPGPERRAAAVDEAVRVLRPGGRLAIVDFRHVGDYERRLAVAGLTRMHRHRLGWRFWYGGPWAGATLLTGTKP